MPLDFSALFKSKLDEYLAQAQSQVGAFLQLKSRIYALPGTPPAALLDEQNALEAKAQDLVSRGLALKDQLSQPVSLTNLNDLMAKGPLAAQAGELIKEAVPVMERIQRQTAAVEAAEGKAGTAGKAGTEFRVPWGYVALIGGAAAYFSWQKGRSRA
jgi:nucleoside phosphorylase